MSASRRIDPAISKRTVITSTEKVNSSVRATRALALPDGGLADVRITVHAAERLIERLRHATDPRNAGQELAQLLQHAVVTCRCPRELRNSPQKADLYIQLGELDIWMPAMLDASGVVIIKTVLTPNELRRHNTRRTVERKRRTGLARQKRADARTKGNRARRW